MQHHTGPLPCDIGAFDAFGAFCGPSSNFWNMLRPRDPVGFSGQWGCYTDWELTSAAGYPLVQMGSRTYDPYRAAFTTRDPLGYNGGLNLYTYCDGDPVNNVDPLGLDYILRWLDGSPLLVFSAHDTVEGLKVGLAATAGSLSLGYYDGGRYKSSPYFATKQPAPRVRGVMWHFYRNPGTGAMGPSAPLMAALRRAGIRFAIH